MASAPAESGTGPDPRHNQEPGAARVSELLEALSLGRGEDRVSVGDLVDVLRDRAFGLLILVLALPNALPGPSIPGVSTLLGIPLVLVALQMALGRRDPWLPLRVRGWSLPRSRLRRVLQASLPWLRRLERLFRPRLCYFADARADRWVGGLVVVLAAVMALPIPLGNLPSALGIVVAALGLLEDDGLAVAVGVGIGVAAVVWNAFIVMVGGAALLEFTQLLF